MQNYTVKAVEIVEILIALQRASSPALTAKFYINKLHIDEVIPLKVKGLVNFGTPCMYHAGYETL